MKTLLTSRCINQRGAGQSKLTPYSVTCKIAALQDMPNEWKDQYRKGERRRTLLLLRDKRPADGFHQKL
ncbi:TPA: hypothetical protein MJB77_28055, partial [Klebsiella pneumoniae]|nr:hypothetical protein [Klebsiella pneumoniae]HBZ0631029.1 hypothetical protein [Klebsiella pneumoniae]